MKEIKLGEAMKRRRIELRLSQEEVCEGICEVITLSRLENGHQSMAYNRVKVLMQRLNMPDDRYYALLNRQEMELDNAQKELSACAVRFQNKSGEQKKHAWTLATEQLHRLELLAGKDDTITRQSILSYQVTLGSEQGPYNKEESLEMLVNALRLTVPEFDLEKLGERRYSINEIRIINQIAGIYFSREEHNQALHLYKQLYEYIQKFCDQLSTYAPHFTLIAHNYARALGLLRYYHESIEIAQQGRQASRKYGYYEFLPGLLHILGEGYYYLGEEQKSKKLMIRAHYLYEELEDEYDLQLIDRDIKGWFDLEFEI